jgi:hypothetical protein
MPSQPCARVPVYVHALLWRNVLLANNIKSFLPQRKQPPSKHCCKGSTSCSHRTNGRHGKARMQSCCVAGFSAMRSSSSTTGALSGLRHNVEQSKAAQCQPCDQHPHALRGWLCTPISWMLQLCLYSIHDETNKYQHCTSARLAMIVCETLIQDWKGKSGDQTARCAILLCWKQKPYLLTACCELPMPVSLCSSLVSRYDRSSQTAMVLPLQGSRDP